MTTPIERDPIYRRRRFSSETIELCVRWYITYRLRNAFLYKRINGLKADVPTEGRKVYIPYALRGELRNISLFRSHKMDFKPYKVYFMQPYERHEK